MPRDSTSVYTSTNISITSPAEEHLESMPHIRRTLFFTVGTTKKDIISISIGIEAQKKERRYPSL